MQYEEEVIKLLQQKLDLPQKEISSLLNTPPNEKFGDIAFPCFKLAKLYKKPPYAIAKELEETIHITKDSIIKKIQAVGAFINFFFDEEKLTRITLKQIWKDKDNYGYKKEENQGKTVVVEFPSPNTNKPLHLGHLRNMALGESVSRILETQGYTVARVNLLNDRGIHICKSMLAYKKWGKNKKPNKKQDHFVGDFYVLFAKNAQKDPKLEIEAQELLKKWEAHDKETIELWQKMNSWVETGFNETYERFGVKFDKTYKESDFWDKGKSIILDNLDKDLFKKDETGSIVVELDKPLGTKVLLRSDGTAIYITQDLYLAKKKFDDYNYVKSIYVVGSEQKHHFKVLFQILKKMGFEFADSCYHLGHGMVYLPEGKMKSREGTVIDADDLINEVTEISVNEINSRGRISKNEVVKTAEEIALAAIKFFLLKFVASKDFIFNPEESVSLYGKTGPYVQYSFVRANKILEKININSTVNIDFKILDKEEEIALTKSLSRFPDVLGSAAHSYSPHILAEYTHELAAQFNLFYEKYRVIGEKKIETQKSRLLLVQSFREVIKNCLYLLGINVVYEM